MKFYRTLLEPIIGRIIFCYFSNQQLISRRSFREKHFQETSNWLFADCLTSSDHASFNSKPLSVKLLQVSIWKCNFNQFNYQQSAQVLSQKYTGVFSIHFRVITVVLWGYLNKFHEICQMKWRDVFPYMWRTKLENGGTSAAPQYL